MIAYAILERNEGYNDEDSFFEDGDSLHQPLYQSEEIARTKAHDLNIKWLMGDLSNWFPYTVFYDLESANKILSTDMEAYDCGGIPAISKEQAELLWPYSNVPYRVEKVEIQ